MKKKAVAKKRFWSLDDQRYYQEGEELPDKVAKKAARLGLVRYEDEAPEAEATTTKQED